MQYAFTDEQNQFREVVRRFISDKSPSTEVRRLMETDDGFSEPVWRQLSSELGLTGVHIPEAYGGLGFGFVELGIVLEEMGHGLLCAPYFSSAVLAACALMNGATEQQKLSLLPAIASGEIRATLAFTEKNGLWDVNGIEMQAVLNGDEFRLTGNKMPVLDGTTADQILVLARTPNTDGAVGLSLFLVSGDAKGLSRRPLKSMDSTRKLARLEFDQVEAELLGEEQCAYQGYLDTMNQASVALANEMTGGAQRLFEMALEYTGTRVQFGRSIGSFQAIKHKCADMLLEVELARSAAYYAASALDSHAEDAPAAAALAKSATAEAYMHTAAECIQIHGGIGFTWDQDTHLWYKRAKSSEVFLGDPAYQRELMMQRWVG